MSVHCGGQWYSSADTLDYHSHIENNGTDSFGSYEALEISWIAAPAVSLRSVFMYYGASDSVRFRAIFDSPCLQSAVPQPPNAAGREFNSSALPLSEFPSFLHSSTTLLSTLGYNTWLGRFCDDRSSHGIGLERYQGGMEGGPLVLFNSSKPSAHALVLAPMDNFFSSIMALRGPRNGQQQEGGELFGRRPVGLEGPCAVDLAADPSAVPSSPLPLYTLLPGISRCASDTCEVEEDIDYIGNDLYSINKVPSLAACCALCTGEPACGYFSLVGDTCYLKFSDHGRMHSPGHVSGRVPIRKLVFGVQGRVLEVCVNEWS